METTRVYKDCWHGVTSEDIQYETTDPDATVKAVERLNGKTKTTASFEHAHTLLSIGGGNEGRYMAFFAKNVDEELFNLVNPHIVSGPANLKIVTGGQAGLFSKRACLDIKTVEQAATYVVATGERERPNSRLGSRLVQSCDAKDQGVHLDSN